MSLSRGLVAPSLAVVGAMFVACATEPDAAPKPTSSSPEEVLPDAGDETTAAIDAGSDADAAPPIQVTFPHVENRGGPVIKTPRVIPIIFDGDPLASSIESFTKKLAGSAYWAATATEYGVGEITAGTVITPSDSAPKQTSYAGIEQWLTQKLSGAKPEFGKPDVNTLYAIYYPSGTVIDDQGSGMGQSCNGYGGYHSAVTVDGTEVGYAVLPRCSGIDELTVAGSHEYFEWSTDPFPGTRPAFQKLDDDHWAWQVAMLGELSDLCTFMDRSFVNPAELGFQVQRHWSNKYSLAGAFPCAPLKNVPYLQAIARAEDDMVVPDVGDPKHGTVKTKAIRVDPGATRNVDVVIYSDKPYAKQVPLRVMSLEELKGTTNTTGYKFALSASYSAVGSTISLAVTAPKKNSYDIAVAIAYVNSEDTHMWPVLVVNFASGSSPAGVQQGADLGAMFQNLAAKAAASRIRTTTAGLPKDATLANGSQVKWLPGLGRVVLPPAPER